MELRHLHYFIAVAEELHFGNAAKRLNISQPPLSQQIIQLEKEMDVKLFNRNNRSVELTKAGMHFLTRAYEILAKVEISIDDTRNIHAGKAGVLNVAFTGSLNSSLIQLIHSHRTQYPDVKVTLHPMSSTDQLKALADNEIHIGFICPPIINPALSFQLIYSSPFVAALPKDHPLAAVPGPIDIKDLKNEPFIMAPRRLEPGYYDTIISICLSGGMSPIIQQEAEGVTHILSLVSAGIGVTLVTESAQLEYPKSGIVYKPLKDNKQQMDLYIAWNHTASSPITDTFVQTMKNSLSAEHEEISSII
ncbi:LysR family transcriptional regulator [Planococcus shenhongbingii]|uniref:LysR family transcriptional regulator n=1 Tax=Planococcus shenhongbingii TaxID=3058398 RepID=UPI00261A5894|nr:LysR family transcriptional regulator [Planococcus sp. N016]WKA57776.1 LysR family transcriptional regulator [Planococcus sp. N016]